MDFRRDQIEVESKEGANDSIRSSTQIQAYIASLPVFCSIEELRFAFVFHELQYAAFCWITVPSLFSLRPDFHRNAMQSLLDEADVDLRAEQEKAIRTIFSSTVFF